MTAFEPNFTMPLAEGWEYFPSAANWADEAAQFGRSDSETAFMSFSAVQGVYDHADTDSQQTVMDAPTDVDGMVEYLTSRPGLSMSEPTDTTIGGRPAVEVEGDVAGIPSVVASEPDSCPMGPKSGELMLFTAGECSQGAAPGEDYAAFFLVEGTRVRFTVVDVEESDRPVVITVEDEPDAFAETAAEADEMLADLQFGGG